MKLARKSVVSLIIGLLAPPIGWLLVVVAYDRGPWLAIVGIIGLVVTAYGLFSLASGIVQLVRLRRRHRKHEKL
jgi:hypothetical protein